MSSLPDKAYGRKIVIKFNKDLIGDVSGNASAFTVSGQEPNPLHDGELEYTEYDVENVERYPIPREWEDDFEGGTLDDVEVTEVGVRLLLPVLPDTISAAADTYSNQRSANSNYGNSDQMNVLGYSGYYCRSYVKFDVSDLHEWQSGITMVELFAYYYQNDTSREQRHHIKRITQDWEEDALTYNNAPSFNGEGSLEGGSYGRLENVDGHGTGVGNWRSEDITVLIMEWLNSTYDNYGLVLDHNYNQSYDGGVWARMRYRTKEFEDGSLGPYLKITYAEGTEAFPPSGTYIPAPIDTMVLPADPRLRFETNEPLLTAITVEYAVIDSNITPPEVWTVADDYDVLSVVPTEGNYLWLRFTLTTEDDQTTPTVEAAWLEEADAPQDTIILNLDTYNKFNNVASNITVEYSQAEGNLTGDSPVENFSESFIPVDLVPDPIHEHTITATADDLIIDFLIVSYEEGNTDHTITATASDLLIVFMHVDDVPP